MAKPQSPDLIDAHAHLSEIQDGDRAVRAAQAAGVTRIMAVGMNIGSNRKTLELARRYPQTVLPAIGYHPWSIAAESADETLAFIAENLGACAALGEVGLDYRIKVKKKLQHSVFAQVLEIAAARHKPVIVHCRYSHARCFQMAESAGVGRAVFHWYSGPPDILERIVAKGWYISATPALAYSRFHQAAVAKAPLGRILAETDSPVRYREKASEPAHLLDTLAALSRIKGISVAEAAAVTAENARRFFGL